MNDNQTLLTRLSELDARLIELLSERINLTVEAGAQLERVALEGLLKSIADRSGADNSRNPDMRDIFNEINESVRQQLRPPRVAFLGPRATYSHLAAVKRFGRHAALVPVHTIDEVFDVVARGKADYGVVPVENSTEGPVNNTLDQLAGRDQLTGGGQPGLSVGGVCGEVFMTITHDLLSRSGFPHDIEVIYTHPQAHRQCRRWLAAHMPEVPVIEVNSTAAAARKAGDNLNAAAIVHALAAPLYGLRVVEHAVQDHVGNTTQFFILGADRPAPTGDDKTSVLFSVNDTPGALFRTLQPLADRGINMTRIVSRPFVASRYRYLFFVDLEGHRQNPGLYEALALLEEECPLFRVLGSFPRAVLAERPEEGITGDGLILKA